MQTLPDRQKILDVRRLIAGKVHRTPVMRCSTLDSLTGASLFFKCENFQKAGAFKFRGASHAVWSLDAGQAARGVATHSSGNHAQALALAAGMRGIQAHIVMPENAPKNKIAAVEAYGGQVRFCQPTLEAREQMLAEVLEQCDALEIHPYNDYRIIAGQATAAAELFEDCPDLHCLLAPVGGGGLLSGSILGARYFSPGTKVFGAEPKNADDAHQSFHQGMLIPVDKPLTIADGLRTSLGSRTFPIILEGASDILTTGEERIIEAMQLIWERMKVVVEPSAAVPLAVVMDHPKLFAGKRTGIILSGGNADLYNLPWTIPAVVTH